MSSDSSPPRLHFLLLGAAPAAAVAGGGEAVLLTAALGLAVGAVLPQAGRWAGLAALPMLLFRWLVPGASPLVAGLIAAWLGPALSRPVPPERWAWIAGGAGAGLALLAAAPHNAWLPPLLLVLACLWTAVLAEQPAKLGAEDDDQPDDEPEREPHPARGPETPSTLDLGTVLIGLRLGLTLALGAVALAFSIDQPGLGAATLLFLSGAGGLALAGAIPGLERSRPTLILVSEASGWAALVLLAMYAPLLPPLALIPLLAVGGATAGGGAAPGFARGQAAPAILGLAAALALADPVLALVQPRWPQAAWVSAALGIRERAAAEGVQAAQDQGDAAGGSVYKQLEKGLVQGDVRPRFFRPGLRPLLVIDFADPSLGAGRLGQRLLCRSGRVIGVAPSRYGGNWSAAADAILQGGLATLVQAADPAAEPGPPVVIGLNTGLTAGIVVRARGSAGAPVQVFEDDPALLAAHEDPGELFGVASGRLLLEPPAGLQLRRRAPAQASLGAPAAIVLADPDPAPALLRLARRLHRAGGPVVCRLTIPDLELPGAQRRPPALALQLERISSLFEGRVWAFWPDEASGLVVVAGLEALSLPESFSPALAQELAPAGLAEPTAVQATCVADPEGVARYLAAAARPLQEDDAIDPRDVRALVAEGAAPPPAIELPAQPEERGRALLALALASGARSLPTCLSWAQQAVELDSSAQALSVYGDLLFKVGQVGQAIAVWQRALAQDPAAIPPRISLAAFHAQNGQPRRARQILRAGLTQAPEAPPLLYGLAELAELEHDYERAIDLFRRAGRFKDARARLARARIRRDRRERRPAAGQRVDMAEALFRQSRGDPSGDKRASAIELALELAQPETLANLAPPIRQRLGRLLGQLAESERNSKLARQNLYRYQAEVLEPVLDSLGLQLLHARALIGAGQADVAQARLEALINASQDPPPRAYLTLGEALGAQDKLDEAIAAVERGLAKKQLSSADAGFLLGLAQLHEQKGNVDKALDVARQADVLVGGYPPAWLFQAQVLLDAGRKGEARAALTTFLELVPSTDPRRRRVEEKLKELAAGGD